MSFSINLQQTYTRVTSDTDCFNLLKKSCDKNDMYACTLLGIVNKIEFDDNIDNKDVD
ncbi:hypothetical protein [Helicobacter sp. MIT 99-5507]|uniref:hypothetical protein n=1 Tax=Helicobacter sp. MIT 99-5507 TaxID=152489 RepID=UPI0015F133D0|nr:hypothetical protein [Helicobacter sp. MIT 99-5507]